MRVFRKPASHALVTIVERLSSADTTSDNRFLLYFASPLPFDTAAFALAAFAALGPWRLGREKLPHVLRAHQIHLFALAWASTLMNIVSDNLKGVRSAPDSQLSQTYYGVIARRRDKNSTLLCAVAIAMHSVAVSPPTVPTHISSSSSEFPGLPNGAQLRRNVPATLRDRVQHRTCLTSAITAAAKY